MAANVGKEHWTKWLSYVQKNIGTLTIDQMADHMQVHRRSLTTCIKVWREEGKLSASIDRTANREQYLPYVQEHGMSQNIQDMASALGVNRQTLSAYIHKWKEEGKVQMPDKRIRGKSSPRTKPNKPRALKGYKETSERTINGIVYVYKHIGEGKYTSLGRKPGQGPLKKSGPAKGYISPKTLQRLEEKKQKEIALGLWRGRQKKKEVKQIPTRIQDMSKMKYVRVSRSTTVLVPKEMDEITAIENWERKRSKI